jgi:hypothetical protein
MVLKARHAAWPRGSKVFDPFSMGAVFPWGDLQVRKPSLRRVQMSDAATFVEEARDWAKTLVRSECRYPGDYAEAMRRVARRTKVNHGLLWALHYRAPKTVAVDQYAKLAGAVTDAQHAYRAERAAVEPKTWLGRALLGAADALAGAADSFAD